MPNQTKLDVDVLAKWLAPLDQLPLECDGLSRVISALFVRESIAHRVLAGSVAIAHGVFKPQDGQHYQARAQINDVASPVLFAILADRQIDDFPLLGNQYSSPTAMEMAL